MVIGLGCSGVLVGVREQERGGGQELRAYGGFEFPDRFEEKGRRAGVYVGRGFGACGGTYRTGGFCVCCGYAWGETEGGGKDCDGPETGKGEITAFRGIAGGGKRIVRGFRGGNPDTGN
jgi:hypothetical protein